MEGYSKWLAGCGIGCVVVIALFLAGGIGTYFFVRDTFQDFAGAKQATVELAGRYGDIRDFTPPLSGRIPADRMESFLKVRAATEPARTATREAIEDIESRIAGFESGEIGGVWAVLSMIRQGISALPNLARLHRERSNALLDQQMGLGEYEYIYVLAYYSWLEKSPGDGPKFLKIGSNNDVNWDPDNDVDGARETRAREIVRRVRSDFRAMFKNALAAGRKGAPTADQQWLSAVEQELAALDASWDRIPWADGLPEMTKDSLTPFRQELDMSYDELNNALELIPLNAH